MYDDTIADVTDAAAKKADLSNERLGAYLVHAAMAGAYVGLAIVLIFALGTPLDAAGSPYTGIVMAGAFGIALSLVIVAGSDLFTGNTMVMAVGYLQGRSSTSDLLRVWGWSWFGNLLGSALVAGLAVGAATFAADTSLVVDVAHAKSTRPVDELFFRAILCNWLVTLAVWCAIKVEDQTARLVMIWWCLLAFIGSGYEHSVANMTVLTMGNLVPNGGAVTWSGMAYNLAVVTAGNVVSGAVMMGAAYWFVTAPDAGESDVAAPTEAASPSGDD